MSVTHHTDLYDWGDLRPAARPRSVESRWGRYCVSSYSIDMKKFPSSRLTWRREERAPSRISRIPSRSAFHDSTLCISSDKDLAVILSVFFSLSRTSASFPWLSVTIT